MRRRLGRRDAEAWRRMGFMHTTATNFVLMWDCRVPSVPRKPRDSGRRCSLLPIPAILQCNTDLGRRATCAECSALSRLQYCRARACMARAALGHYKGSESVSNTMKPLRLAHCRPQCPIPLAHRLGSDPGHDAPPLKLPHLAPSRESLLAAAQIPHGVARLLMAQMTALGASDVEELLETAWAGLPAWGEMRELERRRIVARI